MSIENGSTALISIGGTLVNGTTGQSITETVDAIEVTTKDSDGNKEFIAGESTADVTIDGMADKTQTYGITELRTAKNAKAIVAFVMGPGIDIAAGRTLSGNAIIISLAETQTKNEGITWSAGLKVTGAVTEATSSTTLT